MTCALLRIGLLTLGYMCSSWTSINVVLYMEVRVPDTFLLSERLVVTGHGYSFF